MFEVVRGEVDAEAAASIFDSLEFHFRLVTGLDGAVVGKSKAWSGLRGYGFYVLSKPNCSTYTTSLAADVARHFFSAWLGRRCEDLKIDQHHSLTV